MFDARIILLQLLLTFDPIIVEKVAILLLNMMVVSTGSGG